MKKFLVSLLAVLTLTGCVGYVASGPVGPPVVGVGVEAPVVVVDPYYPYYYYHPYWGYGYWHHPYGSWRYEGRHRR